MAQISSSYLKVNAVLNTTTRISSTRSKLLQVLRLTLVAQRFINLLEQFSTHPSPIKIKRLTSSC